MTPLPSCSDAPPDSMQERGDGFKERERTQALFIKLTFIVYIYIVSL